jgi:hypothetical protein
MQVGLIDVDSKWPNLALMKLSAWHKNQGDRVKFWNAFEPFDLVYASQIFSETHFPYYPRGCVIGGGGYSLETQLPPEIEHIYPDYGLYKIDYAMGYITRGCINHCGFCIVPQKEGLLRFHAPLEEFWRTQDRVMLLDNAITDSPEGIKELEKCRQNGIRVNLTQGFNIRTMTRKIARVLAEIRLWESHSQWHFAWDDPQDENVVMQGIQILGSAGIPGPRLMCYVLVNYNTKIEEDLMRIERLEALAIDPFVMIYNKPHASQQHLALARWCNRPQLRHSCTFEGYALQEPWV